MVSCRSCHGDDLSGGVAGVACVECHLGSETAIHPVNWADDAFVQHRPYVIQEGTAGCANQACHGEDLLGVPGSGPSCSACHEWPRGAAHPASWLPSAHALEARSDPGSCKICHAEDFSGGVAGVACTDCHLGDEISVHPLSWGANPAWKHFVDFPAAGIESCARSSCHGAELQGVPDSGPSCSSCHHQGEGWLPAVHAVRARAELAGCRVCHGEDLAGGIVKFGCVGCHLGDQTTIHPLSWGSNIQAEHGAYVRLNGSEACANAYCHGADLRGVNESGPSCSTCHADKHHALAEQGVFRCSDCHAIRWDDTCQCFTFPVVRACESCHGGGPKRLPENRSR